MTAAEVREACGELEPWLPVAAALTHQPDTDGTRGHGKPSSRPPWNAAAEYALMDAVEGVARLAVTFGYEITGAWPAKPPPAVTGSTLKLIMRRTYALPACPPREYDENGRLQRCQCVACCALRDLVRWRAAILQLAAVGEAERPLKIAGWPCPYCHLLNVYAYPLSGRVACLYGYDAICVDTDGNAPVGLMGRSGLDGTPCIAWSDGLVT